MATSQLRYEYGQRDISLQYAQLAYSSNCPTGVYVQLDDDDTHLWHGVIFLSSGPFSGGVFRFDIVFPLTYPLSTPQVFFPPTLLHPLVEPSSGRMSTATRFPTWKPRTDFVTHLLYFVKEAFEDEFLEGLREGMAANLEVFRMYRDHRTLFNKLALQSVALSTSPSSLYDQSGGSGFPNPSVGLSSSSSPAGQGEGRGGGATTTTQMEEANGMLFKELSEDEVRAIRAEVFGEA